MEDHNGPHDINIKCYTFPAKYDHHQSPIKFNPCYILNYRVLVVVMSIMIIIVWKMIPSSNTKIECLYDPGHSFTRIVNDLIN